MTLRQIANLVTLALALLLLAPAGLILASWNSLPGDSLYPAKRTLEKVALALLSPSYQTQTSLQTKLITRRLDEATTIIDKKSSSAGLEQLKAQLALAQAQVQQAPNQEAKAAATQKLVTTLAKTQAQLETKKEIITQTIVRETVRTVYVTPSPSPAIAPAEAEPPPQIVADIESVQEQIDDIITGLDQPEKPSPGMILDKDDDKDRGKSETHRNRQNDAPTSPAPAR